MRKSVRYIDNYSGRAQRRYEEIDSEKRRKEVDKVIQRKQSRNYAGSVDNKEMMR